MVEKENINRKDKVVKNIRENYQSLEGMISKQLFMGNDLMEEYQVLDKEKKPISLMTFNFQLNQLLMIINNPMMFPHRAYVGLFNED